MSTIKSGNPTPVNQGINKRSTKSGCAPSLEIRPKVLSPPASTSNTNNNGGRAGGGQQIGTIMPQKTPTELPPQTKRNKKLAGGMWGLLGYDAPVDDTIHEAARQGDLNLMKALIQRDFAAASVPGDEYVTPLMLSARIGNLDAVKTVNSKYLIVDVKVDTHARDIARRTALHHLVLGGMDKPLIATCLLEQGKAYIDSRDCDGRSVLHYAAINGLLELVRVLVQYRADPLLTDHEGVDPLKFANNCRKPEAAEIRRVLQEAQVRAKARPHHHGSAWECLARLCDCGDKTEDHDEEEVVLPSAAQHQLLPLFRNAGISPEAIDVYMDSLRRYGYDNLLALKSIASDKVLNRYVPDRSDRRKVNHVLDEQVFIAPPTHLPTAEFLKHLLNVPDDVAVRYADGLRGVNIHTGSQLLMANYEVEIEPTLPFALQGHKKALRLVLLHKNAVAVGPLNQRSPTSTAVAP